MNLYKLAKTPALTVISRRLCNMPPPKKNTQIVWMDMEMTGLDLKKDQIMEVACLITDNQLNIVAEGPNIIVHQPDAVLNAMDEWCTKTHKKTGLFEQCQKSTTSITNAEDEILKFLVDNGIKKSACPLAGNTIYMDRMFLREFMPRIDQHLHYRIIDVSSVKELCKRWNSKVFSRAPRKMLTHRGLDDIRESLAELKYYKTNLFKVEL